MRLFLPVNLATSLHDPNLFMFITRLMVTTQCKDPCPRISNKKEKSIKQRDLPEISYPDKTALESPTLTT